MTDLFEVQLIFLLTGLALLAISAFLYRSTRRFLAVAKTASGTIVGDLRTIDDEGMADSKPRFAFTTEDGQEVVVQSNVGTKPPSFRRGQAVQVLYDPADPTHAKINTFILILSCPWTIPTRRG